MDFLFYEELADKERFNFFADGMWRIFCRYGERINWSLCVDGQYSDKFRKVIGPFCQKRREAIAKMCGWT